MTPRGIVQVFLVLSMFCTAGEVLICVSEGNSALWSGLFFIASLTLLVCSLLGTSASAASPQPESDDTQESRLAPARER